MTEEKIQEYYNDFSLLFPTLLEQNAIDGFTEDRIKLELEEQSKLYADNQCPHSKKIILYATANILESGKKKSRQANKAKDYTKIQIGDLQLEKSKRKEIPYPFDQTPYGRDAWKYIKECKRANILFLGINICGRSW